jgi:serine/threonine protein phosphatase PrpC
MGVIKFQLAAWSEAAGRPYNEDSFIVSKNISSGKWTFTTNETVSLDGKGALLVVCDGMGGMNAGEVASSLAVETVKKRFSPTRLTEDIFADADSIQDFIREAIVAADRKIKEEAVADAGKKGMGSTIVLAWLLGKNVYIGWCGDSRAYRYNPSTGIKRLTRDHSYVQELVDIGKLTQKMAMEHPQSNIITRSLGDSGMEAQPDTIAAPLHNGDVILLCSDGLCGIMYDSEIEAVIAQTPGDMMQCRDALLYASEQAGWNDNITLTLCHVESGGAKNNNGISASIKSADALANTEKPFRNLMVKKLLYAFAAIALLVFAFAGGYYYGSGKGKKQTYNQGGIGVKNLIDPAFILDSLTQGLPPVRQIDPVK